MGQQSIGVGRRPVLSPLPSSEEGPRSEFLPLLPVPLLSPSTAALKDFQMPVLGTSADREPAGSASRPPTAFPPAASLTAAPDSPFYWYLLCGPALGLPQGHRLASWLVSQPYLLHLLPRARSLLEVQALREARPWPDPILLGFGWERLGWISPHSPTLHPSKTSCPQLRPLTKAEPF